MNTVKITVQTKHIKKQTDKYTILEITTTEGKKLDTFDNLEEGKEYEGTITENPNPAYNAAFKLKKEQGKKDYTFEKKRVALECTVDLIAAGKIEMKSLTECRDKFFAYLNEK